MLRRLGELSIRDVEFYGSDKLISRYWANVEGLLPYEDLVVIGVPPVKEVRDILNWFEKCPGDSLHLFLLHPKQKKITRWILPKEESSLLSILDELKRFQEPHLLVSCIVPWEKTAAVMEDKEGYVVESIWGLFLSKGIFPPTVYRIDKNGRVVSVIEQVQEEGMWIEKGKKVKKSVGKAATLTDSEICGCINVYRKITKYLGSPLFVEVGIRGGSTYFIDAVKVTTPPPPEFDVISKGRGCGVVKYVNTAGTTEIHFYDREVSRKGNEKFVYVAEMPTISLTLLLGSAAGFIFRKYSLLSHFSKILREHGIPAIVMENPPPEGKTVCIEVSESRKRIEIR